MGEDALQEMVGPNERRYVVAGGKRDGHLTHILGALHGIVKIATVTGDIGRKSRDGGLGDKLVALACPFPHILSLDRSLLAVGIDHLVVEARIHARIVRDEYGEDAVLFMGVVAQTAAELYAILHGRVGADMRHLHVLILEDVLELHILDAGVERTVVDIERGGDIAFILGGQHHLPALGEILAILNGHVGGRHLGATTERIGETEQAAVAL